MDCSFMSTLPLNMYQTAVHRGEQLAIEFAPVKRVEQPEFSKEEGREGASTSRVHNRVLKSRLPACLFLLIPLSRLGLRPNPDPALFF